MGDYYSSSFLDTQPTSSSSYEQHHRSQNRARWHRRQTLAHGPQRVVLGLPPRASLPPYMHPLPAFLDPPSRRPCTRKLSPSSALVRSYRRPRLFKSPSVGELLKMYSTQKANKNRKATRETVIEPVPTLRVRSSSREIYDDDVGDVGCRCALVPRSCIPVVAFMGIAIMMLLGGAVTLLRNAPRGIPNHYERSYGRQVSARVTTRSSTTGVVVHGHTNLPQRPICAEDSCLWQKRYLLGKLNWTVQPCEDFYSHVCSDEWFKRHQRIGDQYFTFKQSPATMLDLWRFLQEQPVNVTSSFASQASLITRGCVQGSKGDKEWATFRKIFLDLGMPDWPYEDRHPSADAHDIAKVADKLLGLSTLVSTSLKEKSPGGDLLLYVDSPPILLRRYADLYSTDTAHKYTNFVLKAMSLWVPAVSTTTTLALEVAELEEAMSDLAGHSSRSVPIIHMTRAIDTLPTFPNWDWYLYFTYFLRGEVKRRSSRNVALLDPAYFDGLSTLLSQLNSRVLVNYVGYKLLVNLSPLLPESKTYFLMPLSHQYHLVGQASDRLQACMFLLERLYPFGTRSLIWTAMLTKSAAILSGDLAHDLRLFGEKARSEMKQCAAAASWMTQEEYQWAVFKIERMKMVLTPSKEELALRFEPFEPATAPDSSKLLATYYNLVRFIRTQYWFARHLEYFREPETPTETSFIPGFAYDPVSNTLKVSPATVAFVSSISRRLDATAVPFLLSHILQGMFSAMDGRGWTVLSTGDIRSWWKSGTKMLFMEKAACIQNTFVAAARHYSRSGIPAGIFRGENVMNAAVLRPMYNIFQGLVKGGGKFDISGQPVSFQKLFFINWASTLCEPPRGDLYHRQSIAYRLGSPAKLIVNVALSRFAPFSETFKCSPGSPIKSVKPCTFW